MIVKYLRVSITKQDITRQDIYLDKLKISFDREYVYKIIDKTKDRHQLNKMLRNLKNGDIIYRESISRLRRSLKDLIEIIE